jgi:hypothetical protein
VQTEDLNGLIESVYSAIGKAQPVLEAEYFLNQMILSARNDNVDNVNSRILGRFPRQLPSQVSLDSQASGTSPRQAAPESGQPIAPPL